MKTITVKDLKAHGAKIEAQVRARETFEVLNRGKAAAHVDPTIPRQVLRWPDHLAAAHKNTGRQGTPGTMTCEEGTVDVYDLVVAQAEPLPVGHCLYLDRKGGGQYSAPHLAPSALHELCLMKTGRTPIIGCRVVKPVAS